MNPAHMLQTEYLAEGFLNYESHASAYKRGQNMPRVCRLCGKVMSWVQPNHTAVLACTGCDPVASL